MTSADTRPRSMNSRWTREPRPPHRVRWVIAGLCLVPGLLLPGARGEAAAAGTLSPHGTTLVSTGSELGAGRGNAALPYRPPARVPHGGDRLVLAHYHPFFPLSKDDRAPEEDCYTQRYLLNSGDGAAHLLYGGYLRDRPLPRAPLGPGFQAADFRTEVQRAVAAGLDGFTVDLIGTFTSRSDTTIRGLLEAAAQVDPRFTLTLMPDLWPGAPRPTPAQMAAYLGDLGRNPLVQRVDGHLVVAPFGPDREGAAYWSQVLGLLRTAYDEDPFFVPCLLDYWSNVDDFADLSDGLSAWGYHNIGADRAHRVSEMADDAHRRGLLWMAPVAFGDNRPRLGVFNESANTSLLRRTFANAGEHGAEWVQVVTWNDYGENTFVSPSPTIGWAVLDLVSWLSDRYRSGRSPEITRDVAYLSYRTQQHDAVASLQPVPPTARPGTPARDQVEALVFLRRPSRVLIQVGDDVVRHRVAAGVHAVTAPLLPGTPEVTVLRGGRTAASVAGMFPVREVPEVQTLNYYVVSSGRTGS